MSRFSGSYYNDSESESGWTGYFEESFETEGRLIKRSVVDYGGGREEEEGMDFSMISDASSVPRNVFYEENCQSVNGKRKQCMGLPNQYSCLDDTASSSVFGLTKREIKESFGENVKKSSQSQTRKPHGKVISKNKNWNR